MYSFNNDYSETAHPRVLKSLVDLGITQLDGYGLDEVSDEAKKIIMEKIEDNTVDIHFISGGTQTNLLACSAFLRAHEAVISASTGHIVEDETGAIEATGHKVFMADTKDGKINCEDVENIFKKNSVTDFSPYPKMVYISNPTELGTVYNKKELNDLYECCKKYGMYFYVDGARMASVLTLKHNDIEFKDMPKLCDAFYIGGTKNGAMYGEALVICNDDLKNHFRWNLKQRGAMLAKAWTMSVQFAELMSNNLFEELGLHANKMAEILRDGMKKQGISFYVDSPTNQIFVLFSDKLIEKLSEKYLFSVFGKTDENISIVRLVTSWATQKEKVMEFLDDLEIANK